MTQPAEELYLKYLTPLIEHEAQSAPDVWKNTGSGGYLFRFWLDVNNDGKKELFLASSLWANNLSADWTVYREQPDGSLVAYENTMKVPMTQLVLQKTPQGIAFLSWSQDQGNYFLDRYEFKENQIVRSLKEVPENVIRSLETGQNVEKITPQLEAIYIADFLRNPRKQWMLIDPLTLEGNSNGYVVIPEDAERVKDIKLSPQMALQEIQHLIEEGSQPPAAPTMADSTPVSPSSPKLQPWPTPTAVATTTEPGFPIIPVAILVAAIVALAVFLMRRKFP